MRAVLSISLPKEKKEEIEERARSVNQSVSAYLLQAFELEKSLISEDELLMMAQKAKKDYEAKKTKKLGSLADLM